MENEQIQNPSPAFDLRGWAPEALFAEVAARRGLTVEELRKRTRHGARESTHYAAHIPFENVRDLSFTDEQLVHLEQCNFCLGLLESIRPEETTVMLFEEFVGLRLGIWSAPENEHRKLRNLGLIAMTPLLFGGLIYLRLNQVELTSVVSWALAGMGMVLLTIILASWVRSSPKAILFSTAAECRREGKIETTNDLLLKGLAGEGLDQESLSKIKRTLEVASDSNALDRYAEVAHYLERTRPKARATKAYRKSFVNAIAHIAD